MKLTFRGFCLAFFLAVVPTALASTTWYVDGVHGNDSNNCRSTLTACKTIGHAISLASSGDTVSVFPATYTENLTIGISLEVVGSGAATTIIDGGGIGTVVTVSRGFVSISRVTIRNGKGKGAGGGINNAGKLIINNSTISGNVVEGFSVGGGISSGGILTINGSTLSGNSAGYRGGGIYNTNTGTLRIFNSTISGNSAGATTLPGGGGGIDILSGGMVTISNSTISGNSATGGGGIDGVATLQNSIVSDNTGGNCSDPMTSSGHNLSSDGTCNFTGPGDLNNTDPKLGPLQNNGGETQTQALLSGSPAIDAGNPSGCTDGNGKLLKTDQRGARRPDNEDSGGCDMGAYESQTD